MDTGWTATIVVLLFCTFTTVTGLPDLRDTPTDPITVHQTDDAVFTCVVKHRGNNTIIWKLSRFGRESVLSANLIKVTNDPRVSIAHNEDGNQWILTITDVTVTDAARYTCQVNSVPVVEVSMMLRVMRPISEEYLLLNHNYTECCVTESVPETCIGFCSLQNIVMGTTRTTPGACREFLPRIAHCMADGRNHMPCCVREKVPQVCRDVCVGKFGLINETVANHYTCSRYSRVTIACIAEGIELLPGPPRQVIVEPISEKEIKVEWQPPIQNVISVTHYVLNVTELATFDDMSLSTWDYDHRMNQSETNTGATKYTEITVNGSETNTTLNNLKPYTMYELQLIAFNKHGTSMPSSTVRTLTLSPETSVDVSIEDNSTLPELPKIRECCASKGMALERCLDLFCDPVKADVTKLTDMMICAPWINISVMCLADGKDHTPCCRQRGIPDLCIPLCGGKIERIDFHHFRCIAFMDSFTSCLMQGYGVLASAPKDLHLVTTTTSWAVIAWKLPEKHPSSVTSYNVHLRSLTKEETLYTALEKARSPFILNELQPDNQYEVYVTAVNQYGVSEPSPRIFFSTDPVENVTEEMQREDPVAYNITECCANLGFNSTCMPLCSYKAKMVDLQRLSSSCMPEFHKLLKCAVAGRNHVPCCIRRLVSTDCSSMCAGMMSQLSPALATMCIPFIPDIIMCMEEGSTTLPGPVRQLHSIIKDNLEVLLTWEPPNDSNVSYYQVRYEGEFLGESLDKMAAAMHEQILNVTDTSVAISNLEDNVLYNIYVVSVNEYGTSIPSSIVTFNTSQKAQNVTGVISPPHSLTISHKNSTSLILTWLPPVFSHPTDVVTYNVFYKIFNETEYSNLTTMALVAFLNDLHPNTEYFIHMTASTDKGESWPSEKLQVWTDPLFPAFVEMPRIHPANQIQEGGSMTILCISSGSPTPKVQIYVSGKKIVEGTTRHLIARISNVTRNMTSVACIADNKLGFVSQAVKRIKINYPPIAEGKRLSPKMIGEVVSLECIIDGFPKPHLTWWKDHERTISVIPDARIVFGIAQDFDGNDVFQMVIHGVMISDEGLYYCNAENPFGSAMGKVNLQLGLTSKEESTEEQQQEQAVSSSGAPSNVSLCCMQENVHPDCLQACTFDIDVEAVIQKEQCLPELGKLLYCAADGSDHRRCCQTWGIPKRCIGLCQGKQLTYNVPLCILSWTKEIVACFQEGKHILPGVPINLRVKVLTKTSVLVEWDPPNKNPHTVQFYRVFARPSAQKKGDRIRNETHGLSIVMTGLKSGLEYEFLIKAGNHYGASVVSEPIKIALVHDGVAETAGLESSSDHAVAIAVGVILAVIIVTVVILIFIYFKKRVRPPPPDGISFENPSYMREMQADSTLSNGVENGGFSEDGNNRKSESQRSPGTFENLYEIPDEKTRKPKGKNGLL